MPRSATTRARRATSGPSRATVTRFTARRVRRPRLSVRSLRRQRQVPGSYHASASGSCLDGANIVGRGPECTVRIDDRSVSRRHARIIITGINATIENLGSKNGTSVNGDEVGQPVALEDGAQIRIGSVTVTYRILETLPLPREPCAGCDQGHVFFPTT